MATTPAPDGNADPIYAATHLLHDGRSFKPGDDISHLPAHLRAAVLKRGDATTKAPVKP